MNRVREKSVVIVSGITQPISSIGIKTSNHEIVFSGRGNVKTIIMNDLVTDDGRTVGERQRAELHTMLDQWIDGTWVDS